MNSLTDLARAGIQMLDKQQEYFKCNPMLDAERKGRLLKESKQLEREFRKLCEAALHPQRESSLFDADFNTEVIGL